MKKSKIIVPALGILAFSTAAAVTGTVAWFTANRTVTINNTAITAFNPEAGLKVTVSAAKGATISTAVGTGDTPAVVSHKLLRDASIDFASATTPKVYRSILNDAGEVGSYGDVSTAALAGTAAGKNASNVDYFWCSSYTATFQLEQNVSSTTYTLSYDNSKLDADELDSVKDIKEALRIGIYVSKTKFLVVAPFKTAGDVNYVNGTTLDDDENVYSGALLGNAAGLLEIGDLQGTGTQAITVYTWFEGTDPKCENGEVDGQALSVALGFKMVEKAAA